MRLAAALPLAALLVTDLAGAQAPTGAPAGASTAAPAAAAATPPTAKAKGGAKTKPSGKPKGKEKKVAKDEPPPPPPVPVTLRVIAPSARGQWLLRIDNEGDAPALIAADVRLLRFEIRQWDAKKGAYAKKGAVCDGPAVFGLEHRAPFGRDLVLERGQSYVEAFDPRLICFGKQAALLEPGVMVMPTYGFVPTASAKGRKSKKPEIAPFVADTAAAPRAFSPVKRLTMDSLVLGDAPGAAFPPFDRAPDEPRVVPASAEAASRPVPIEKPKPYQTPKDGLAAAMSLTTDRFADAGSWQSVAFEVEAHNVGERPIWVAVRARQISFMVHGPDGDVYCPRVSQDHHIPRDMFEQLPGGKHRHVGVNLSEPCGTLTFQRPGLYAVVPTLHADDNGAEYGIVALTGTVTTRDPGKVGGTHLVDDDATLVRVRTGPQPFYAEPPRAIPTAEAPNPPAAPSPSVASPVAPAPAASPKP